MCLSHELITSKTEYRIEFEFEYIHSSFEKGIIKASNGINIGIINFKFLF